MMWETREEWHACVKACEDIGVDGFELNFGCPHGMCERGMGSAVGQNPDVAERITAWVMEVATKPVIVKLTPNITDITAAGLAAQRGGAQAVSLINTINSVTGVNLSTMTPNPSVDGFSSHGGYCGPAVKPIALNMVSELYNHPDFHLPISGIGGIENWQDATEFFLMGAASVQVCTAVMHYGFRIVEDLVSGLNNYLDEQKLNSPADLTGLAARKLRRWEELDLNYKVIASIDAEKCIGCQLCYIACEDGAHQSIALQNHTRVPRIKEQECVGCNLCSLICPVDDCITMVQVPHNQGKLVWAKHPANPVREAPVITTRVTTGVKD
jgi:dihydropyrimidine dehydrogenase (NAD+) subunit PreA